MREKEKDDNYLKDDIDRNITKHCTEKFNIAFKVQLLQNLTQHGKFCLLNSFN